MVNPGVRLPMRKMGQIGRVVLAVQKIDEWCGSFRLEMHYV
jgi:hypothetical protein